MRSTHDVPYTVLDIETDTEGVNGLDPTVSRVVSAALAFSDADPLVFDDADERVLLARLDAAIASRSGLLVTWNGAGFDLPFCAVRLDALVMDSALQVQRDPSLPVKYTPPPGLGDPVRARWGGTAHVDISFLYKDHAEREGIAWSLKPVARSFGMDPVEVDRARIHDLTTEEVREYVLSDVHATLELARRLPLVELLRAVRPLD